MPASVSNALARPAGLIAPSGASGRGRPRDRAVAPPAPVRDPSGSLGPIQKVAVGAFSRTGCMTSSVANWTRSPWLICLPGAPFLILFLGS